MITADFTFDQIKLMPRPEGYKKELEDCAVLKTDTYIRIDVQSECFKNLHIKYRNYPKPEDLSKVTSPTKDRSTRNQEKRSKVSHDVTPEKTDKESKGCGCKDKKKTKVAPPSKKPPSFFGKVASYWRAVTGPRVDEATFEARKKQCFELGGYTWSPIDGTVTSVTDEAIYVDDMRVALEADETPIVVKGQAVQPGEPVATGTSKKPCPYLMEGNGTTEAKYYCNACGCGARKAANLDEKLKMANVECPRTPPLFTQVTVNGGQGKGTSE